MQECSGWCRESSDMYRNAVAGALNVAAGAGKGLACAGML